MIFAPEPPSKLVNNWIDRHQDIRSFVLHLLGIPCTILGVLLIPVYVFLLSFRIFSLALMLFVGGFLIQFLGHAIDGTEPGEIKGLRTWLSRRREANRQSMPTMQVALPDGEGR